MALITAAAIIGGASLLASGVSAYSEGRRAKKNREAAKTKEQQIVDLEQGRQETIDPYDQMRNLGAQITSQGDKLTVATKSAEFQAEQADISLANTLGQMRAFGMGGGGATALAQGSLQSKRGISAGIEQQEAKNALTRFQSSQQQMYARIGEDRRMQAMRAKGRAYEFETQENRDMARLDRLAGQETGYRTAANQAAAHSAQMWGSAIPNAVGAAMSVQNQFG